MHEFDDLPVPPGPDPISSDDATTLRVEILRLRDSLLATNGRIEVLCDRIVELEESERRLDAAHRALQAEMARNPLHRLARRVRRDRRPTP